MSLEMEVQMLRRAIQDLTAAMRGLTASEEEVLTIDVITPTHADYISQLAKFKRGETKRKTRKDKGSKNPNYPAVTYSRCCGAEGRKKSKFDGKCFACR
jgi:hypothetical protein